MGSGNTDTGYGPTGGGGGGSSSGGSSGSTYTGTPGGTYTGQPPGDYTGAPYTGTPGGGYQSQNYTGDPGGAQGGIQFGNNGQAVQFNTTPQYEAMTKQIDYQTQDQINQLQEQFGDAGMRWSTPLLSQMGATNQRAAADKNELLATMNFKEQNDAYQRARGEQQDIYGRSRDQEQERYGRSTSRDARDYDRAYRAEDERYGRYDRADDKGWNRSRDVEQEKYERSKGLEKEAYERWAQGDMQGYQRAMEAARMEMALSQQENDYNRQTQMDLWGMGGDEEGSANADLKAYLDQWMQSQDGYMPDIMQLLNGGYNPQLEVDKGVDWASIISAIGSAYGSSK